MSFAMVDSREKWLSNPKSKNSLVKFSIVGSAFLLALVGAGKAENSPNLSNEDAQGVVAPHLSAKEALERSKGGNRETTIFVMGIAHGMFWANASLHVSKSKEIFCGPLSLDTGRVFDILASYVAKYPEAGAVPVGNVLLLSFIEAFPCAY